MTTEPRCCDRNCPTPFCPICGKQMQQDAAHGLLNHIRQTLKRQLCAMAALAMDLKISEK